MKCCSGSKTRLIDIFRPVRTRPAAAALFSGVIKLMAPLWSSAPQRPQLRRSVYHDLTSAAVGIRGSDCPAAAVRTAATVSDACVSSSSVGEKLFGAVVGWAIGSPDAAARPPSAAAPPAAAELSVVRNRRLEEATASSFQ